MERKVESDTLEEEARSKNLSLNEIEEQRTLRSGGRTKARKRHTKKVNKQTHTLILVYFLHFAKVGTRFQNQL